jgi:hypothetical protein
MNTIGIVLTIFTGSTVLYAIWVLWNDYALDNPSLTSTPAVLPYISTLNEPIISANDLKIKAFKDLVVSRFDKTYFHLLRWQSQKHFDGWHPLSNNDPDLVFEFRHRDKFIPFAVQCKWSSDFRGNTVAEIDNRQIKRYYAFQEQQCMSVFIVVGIGGLPHEPANLYVVPLSYIPKHTIAITRDFLQPFIKQPDQTFFLDTQRMLLK